MSNILGIDHVSILVQDADESLKFYQQLLDLKLLERPDLGFPGYWLDLTKGQSLHLMQLENPNNGVERPAHGGRDFHFALRVKRVDVFRKRLDVLKASYTESRSGRKAVFVRDLDDNAFELFEMEE